MFVFVASLAGGQAVEPKMSDASHAKIRDIQLQQKNVETQYLQMQQQMENLKSQYNQFATQLAKAEDDAYKEAGAKPEEWSLNVETLKFVKIEKPKPEEKKK